MAAHATAARGRVRTVLAATTHGAARRAPSYTRRHVTGVIARAWNGATALSVVVGVILAVVNYHAILADDQDLHGFAQVADVLLHTVVPALAMVGWLVFGPRGRAPAI